MFFPLSQESVTYKSHLLYVTESQRLTLTDIVNTIILPDFQDVDSGKPRGPAATLHLG